MQFESGGAHGECGARAYKGAWGRSPQRGPGAEPLVRGSGREDCCFSATATVIGADSMGVIAPQPKRCGDDAIISPLPPANDKIYEVSSKT